MKNIMEKIAGVKINPCYDVPGENVLEVADKSGNRIEAVINGFRFGYLQGCKATKAEMRRTSKMTQIKEKAPGTATTVQSAKTQNHIEDTTDRDKMQERYCASNYLDYCKLQGQEPNPYTMAALARGLKKEPAYKTRQELDAELISLLAQANGHETIAALDLARFITYMNKRETGRQKANG